MRAVDTNVLVRLLVRDDPMQLRAAEQFVASGAWVSHIALAESTWVLATVYRRSARQIAMALEALLDYPKLALQDPEVVAAALQNFSDRPRLGFSDYLLLEIARKAGNLPLGTFDRDLARLDGTQRIS